MNYIKTMEEYDCDIDILDYAIESANFEIVMGNEEYLPIHEAFIKKKEKTFGDKVKSFIDKIIKFFKSLLDRAKDSFRKLEAWITRKRVQRQVKKNIANAKVAAADKASQFALSAGATVVSAAGIYALVKLGKVAKANKSFEKSMQASGLDGNIDKEVLKEFKKAVFSHPTVKKTMKVNLTDMIFFGKWIIEDIKACINIADKAVGYTGEKFKNFSEWISERLKFDRAAVNEFENTNKKLEDEQPEIINVDPADIR